MSIFVFVGPTLGVEEARTILDATYLPPASQGDVFRLVATHDARIVGIIDGHFQEVPSVWHKELLWAMSQGIHVLGAASMGALRAAELAAFGMVGEGRIFEAYRTGVLEPYDAPFEDDDEVAVVYAPAELGFGPLSDALVDIRCTLDLASREKVISVALRDRLAGLGKSCFYTERNYEALLDLAFRDGWPAPELKRLRDWLPRGRISQKMEDARAMLARIQTGDFGDRKQVTFDFHHTTVWDRLTVEALEQQPVFAESGLTGDEQAVIAEARLLPDEYLKAKEQAERVLRIGPCPPVRCVALAMLDVLRQEGSYAGLAARAGRKASWLSAAQMPRASDLTGLQALQLFEWYFGRRLAHDIPNNVEGFVQSLGYHDRKDFIGELLKEYAFVNSQAGLETS
jgi:hypothetical protein